MLPSRAPYPPSIHAIPSRPRRGQLTLQRHLPQVLSAATPCTCSRTPVTPSILQSAAFPPAMSVRGHLFFSLPAACGQPTQALLGGANGFRFSSVHGGGLFRRRVRVSPGGKLQALDSTSGIRVRQKCHGADRLRGTVLPRSAASSQFQRVTPAKVTSHCF